MTFWGGLRISRYPQQVWGVFLNRLFTILVLSLVGCSSAQTPPEVDFPGEFPGTQGCLKAAESPADFAACDAVAFLPLTYPHEATFVIVDEPIANRRLELSCPNVKRVDRRISRRENVSIVCAESGDYLVIHSQTDTRFWRRVEDPPDDVKSGLKPTGWTVVEFLNDDVRVRQLLSVEVEPVMKKGEDFKRIWKLKTSVIDQQMYDRGL